MQPARIVFNGRVLLIVGTWATFGLDVLFWLLIADYVCWLFKYPTRGCDVDVFRTSDFPDRLYELVPSKRFHFFFGSRLIRKRVRKVAVTVNSHGFRVPEIPVKDESSFRILILGDSTMFGSGVEDGQEFIRLLEDLWNRQETFRRRIELINGAVDGYNTRQEVAVLRQHGEEFQPDMVWMFVSMDDALPWGTIKVGKDGRLSRPGGPLRIRLRNCLTGFSGLIWWIHDIYRHARISSHVKTLWHPNHYGYQDWKRAVQQYAQLVESPRTSITFVMPALWNLRCYPWKGIHERIQQHVEACGLPCIDLLPAFEGKTETRYWCHYLDQHPNALGHKCLAEYISRNSEVRRIVDCQIEQHLLP